MSQKKKRRDDAPATAIRSSNVNDSQKSNNDDSDILLSGTNSIEPQAGTKKQYTTDSDSVEKGNDNPKKTDEGCCLRKSSYIGLTDAKYIVGISLQGRSHLHGGTECQDSHSIKDLGDGWILAIVSDGAGSAKDSARGSEANCTIVGHLLERLFNEKDWIKTNYLPNDKEWYIEMYNILSLTQKIIAEKATEQNMESRSLNATVIVLVVTPRGMLTAHIGDGRMGYKSIDGAWHSLMVPHKGEEANQTVFIPNDWNMFTVPAFRMSGVNIPETRVVQEHPAAFVLISDGCEHSMWRCSLFNETTKRYEDLNQPHDKFLDPLLADVGEKKGEKQRIDRLIYITDAGTRACLKEQDDRTIVIGHL